MGYSIVWTASSIHEAVCVYGGGEVRWSSQVREREETGEKTH